MIRLEVFAPPTKATEVAGLLRETEGVRHIWAIPTIEDSRVVTVATVQAGTVDPLMHSLRGIGIPEDEISLTRMEQVGRSSAAHTETAFVWEDVIGTARTNARPVASYLVFMLVAGFIACYGVIDRNGILIVGAMAVSPDLLPITAIGVALVGRRLGLAGRALATMAVGLGVATLAAALSTAIQNRFDLIPESFNLDDTVLGTLTTVNNETFVVALAAGIAGMLAFETRASSGVGVAISVTTIPAAAYLGVAIGLGKSDEAWGALGVLSVNVAMLIVGASLALLAQRRLSKRPRSSPRMTLDPSNENPDKKAVML